MSKPKVLIQMDSDAAASVFDAMVAIDSSIDHLLQYRGVTTEQVRDLVHGAMFTRGPKDLHHTAIFVGGQDVAAGEKLLADIATCFFGPMRVSVMMDANGANTTAAAAVLSAARHVDLRSSTVAILAGTGPVGQRSALLAARAGAKVRVASRRQSRAEQTCQRIRERCGDADLTAVATGDPAETAAALAGANVLIAAGAAGCQLLAAETRQGLTDLRVAIDLNAVPPEGLEGVAVTAAAEDQNGAFCYGAIGVGGTKMRIHKACIRRLFESNDQLLDAEEIYLLGTQLDEA